VCPASFIAAVWFLGWATNSDPLVLEIWRLRGQVSVLRERLRQLECGSDEQTVRRVIEKRGGVE